MKNRHVFSEDTILRVETVAETNCKEVLRYLEVMWKCILSCCGLSFLKILP